METEILPFGPQQREGASRALLCEPGQAVRGEIRLSVSDFGKCPFVDLWVERMLPGGLMSSGWREVKHISCDGTVGAPGIKTTWPTRPIVFNVPAGCAMVRVRWSGRATRNSDDGDPGILLGVKAEASQRRRATG